MHKLQFRIHSAAMLLLWAVGVLLLGSGCNRALTAEEYVEWFENNRGKFSRTIERNGVKCTVRYMPTEYYAARDMLSDTTLEHDAALRRYENAIFLLIGIESRSLGNHSILLARDGWGGFKRNVFTNTFNRADCVYLVNGTDTAMSVEYRYERSWGLGDADAFLFAFPRPKRLSMVNPSLVIRNIMPELGTVAIDIDHTWLNSRDLRG